MNLIVGATGILGSEICRLLAENRQPVRALVRPKRAVEDKLRPLKSVRAHFQGIG